MRWVLGWQRWRQPAEVTYKTTDARERVMVELALDHPLLRRGHWTQPRPSRS